MTSGRKFFETRLLPGSLKMAKIIGIHDSKSKSFIKSFNSYQILWIFFKEKKKLPYNTSSLVLEKILHQPHML